MPHDRPKYLDGQPKERSGVYSIIAISMVLAVALFGAWKLYIGTVVGWEKRFNSPAPAALNATVTTHEMTPDAKLVERRLRDLAEARKRNAATKPDKCIDGVTFKKLRDGGWENIPNIRCTSERKP